MRNISTKRIISDKELPAKKGSEISTLNVILRKVTLVFLVLVTVTCLFLSLSLEATKDDLPEIEINAYCIVDQAV